MTVNSQSTQRQGEHWFKQLALSGNSAQWQSVAVSISTGGSSSGSVLLKEHPEVYAYDDDGNLTSDGRWTYIWDAENRLRRMETASVAYTAGAPRKRIDYTYDDRGRRTLKSVYTWNTGTSAFNTTPAAKIGFLYHDWNLLHEIDLSGSSPVTLRSYYWGSDLSGTLQGAGGVGGLLAADFNSGGYFWSWAYSSDANGNVRDLVGFDDGYLAEHYEYDAFGNAFAESGGGGANPFRFSTKYTETDVATGGNETGLLYYGYRFYNSGTGRWPNRDPINERGAKLLRGSRDQMHFREELNLYGMVGNNAISHLDYLGLYQLYQPNLSTIDYYIVDKCEILIVYGHRTVKGRTAQIATPYRCSAGAADVCNPGAANGSVTRLLEGAEMHDQIMRFSNSDEPAANVYGLSDGVDRTNAYSGINQDGHLELEQLRQEAERKARALLKSCKCPGGVTISEVRRGIGPPARAPILIK